MIKRRFYNLEHGDVGDDSDSSSSSSSSSDPAASSASSQSDSGPQRPADEEPEEVTSSDKGSGYESEDSSGNEVHCDSSGLPVNDDDECTEEGKRHHEDNLATFISTNKKKEDYNLSNNTESNSEKDAVQPELEKYILRCKSVFKCRLCPRIVCLSEETLKTHLNSKGHARSKKLLNEGRLKVMLNSDGEIEEEQETHAERHARTMTVAQDLENLKKRNKGRQRQRNRLKKKVNNLEERKAKQVANTQTRKKCKVKD